MNGLKRDLASAGEPPALQKTILIIVPTFVFLAAIYGRVIIQNDGITYYAMTLSLVEDHDLDLTNQNQRLPDLRVSIVNREGKAACRYSCGFAVLYSPTLWAMTHLSEIFPILNNWRPYGQNRIFPISHSLAIFLNTFFFGLLTILISCKLLRDLYQITPGSAALITLALFAGTPLIFYTFTTPSFVHTPDAFLITFASLLALNRTADQSHLRLRNILLGFILALSVSMRNNNFVMIPLFAGWIVWVDRKNGWRRMTMAAMEFFAGALPIAAFQAVYSLNQYGEILGTGYRINLVQDFAERVSSGLNFYPILIHPSAGAFLWAPIIAISIVGLIVGSMKKRPVAIFSLLVVAVVILSLRFAGIIWTGAGFGQRYLTHLYVFWVIGFYELYQIWRRPAIAFGTIAFIWTFLLFNLYYINFAHLESRIVLTQNSRGPTPLLVLKAAAKGYEKAEEKNVLKFWWSSLESYPYPSLEYIIRSPEPQRKARIE